MNCSAARVSVSVPDRCKSKCVTAAKTLHSYVHMDQLKFCDTQHASFRSVHQPLKVLRLLHVPSCIAVQNSTLCHHSEFECLVRTSEQTATFSLYSNK